MLISLGVPPLVTRAALC